MPTPKIDYKLLGQAVSFYEERGFKYVEVPWAVEKEAIRATLPEDFPYMEIAEKVDGRLLPSNGENCLVGSAEQGFLALNLLPGKYVGVTPCFRIEPKQDLFYQEMFMKVELYSNHPNMKVEEFIKSAELFFQEHSYGTTRRLETRDGTDLMLADIEIGSYGERLHDDLGRWVYGTGLALPRFSVANALARVL